MILILTSENFRRTAADLCGQKKRTLNNIILYYDFDIISVEQNVDPSTP